jgi:hypothetical protein
MAHTLYDNRIYEAAKEEAEQNDETCSVGGMISNDCFVCARIVLKEENPELYYKVKDALDATPSEVKHHFIEVVERYHSSE